MFSLQLCVQYCLQPAVLPGPDNPSRPHSPKTTAILELFTATYQKYFGCMIYQSTTAIKHNVREGIMKFFYFWSLFLDEKLHKCSYICTTAPICHSRPLSQPPVSHRKLFFYTACFELFSGGYGHLGTLPEPGSGTSSAH